MYLIFSYCRNIQLFDTMKPHFFACDEMEICGITPTWNVMRQYLEMPRLLTGQSCQQLIVDENPVNKHIIYLYIQDTCSVNNNFFAIIEVSSCQ